MTPDVERVRELFTYDPETGLFWWRISGRGIQRTKPAGSKTGDGGWRLKIAGTEYVAARVAFYYMTGRWPSEDIDHKDCDRMNNRWSNLREATRSENIANCRRREGPHSCHLKGVSFEKQTSRWRARIRKAGKLIGLGRYNTPEEAHAAYLAAARDLFGEFHRAC